ncbi:MAG TPA: S41 family peptidase, partial [Kofleriaceae bacterium]|nr:S41 family peptidase [Kofleriaceae bacterium]
SVDPAGPDTSDGDGDGGGGGGDGGGGGTSSFRHCDGDSAAHETFNAFWSTFDLHYAVFDVRLRGTSWAAIGEEACAALLADISGDDLFDLLIGMAEHLDDGHVTLTAPELGRDEDAEVSVYPHYDAVYELEDLVEEEYLDDSFERAAEDEISWGTIGAIGYISITSMEELSASGDEEDDVAAARQAMAAAMDDLAGVDGIVVDVRANEGGWDAVSLEIAAWFAGPRAVAWSEQVRSGPAHDDLSVPVATYVDATRAGGFAGPVVLLTSGGTYSAAETFALAMRVRDDVLLLGERSSGHFSDMIGGELPGGWELTYSGERYIAADGNVYEASGVPVDIAVPLDLAALARGEDAMLAAALAELGGP